MKKKALLMLASLGLLTTVLIYGTIAWYTNIANVTGLTFDVAEFDFQVNYKPDHFVIQLDNYTNVSIDKAAPGTGGVIPVRVSATGDVGATYAINLDFSEMAPEFKERIRFYYYDKDGKEWLIDENTQDITGTIASNGSVTEFIYWEWIYTADITPILIAPYGENGNQWTSYKCMDDMTYAQIEQAVENWDKYLNDDANSTVVTKYNELAALGHMDHMDPKSGSTVDTNFQTLVTKVNNGSLTGRALKEEIEKLYLDAHDKFDTELALGEYDSEFFNKGNNKTYNAGKTTVEDGQGGTKEVDLLAYQKAMTVTLMVSGAQAMPEKQDSNNPKQWESKGTTKYVK